MRVFVGVCQILCVRPSFPFGIEGRMWVVIVLIPDHCLSVYFPDLHNVLSYSRSSVARTLMARLPRLFRTCL